MNKPLKITLWSIVGLLGLCLLAVGLVLYIFFSPAKLTRLVNRFAENYVECPYEIGRIEPTFFSTFPQFGLKVDSIMLYDGDSTWASLENLQAKVDIKAMTEGSLQVDEVLIQGLNVNLSIDTAGQCNFDVFRFPEDTLNTAKDSVFHLPFDKILLSRLGIRRLNASFKDERSGMSATLKDFRLRSKLNISEREAEGLIQLGTSALGFRTAAQVLADNLPLKMHLPIHLSFENPQIDLDDASIELASLPLQIDGSLSMDGSPDIDAELSIGSQDNTLADYLVVLPDKVAASLQGLDTQGKIRLQGHLDGRFTEQTWPKADIRIQMEDLDYRSDSLECQASALNLHWQSGSDLSKTVHLDMGECPEWHLKLKGIQSEGQGLQLEAEVEQLLRALQAKELFSTQNTSDFMKNLPEAKLRLDLEHLVFQQDSLLADLNRPHIQAEIGDSQHSAFDKSMSLVMNTADCHLLLDSTDITSAEMTFQAQSQHRSGQSNPLHEWNPQLTVGLENGTVCLPVFTDTFDIPSIRFQYQDEVFHIQESSIRWGHSDIALSGKVYQLPQYLDKSALLKADLDFVSHHADINELIAFTSGLGDDGTVEEEEKSAEATAAEPVTIQKIDTEQTEKQLVKSKKKSEKKSRKQEELSQTVPSDSSQSDSVSIERIMADSILWADTTAGMATDSGSVDKDAHPFIVPKGMDVVLHTRIEEAEFSNQHLHNLGGNLYIRDGVMILEEIGFICEAAKLKLTAMYKTPRPNHIYAGLDYHMTDVKIDEIVDMIPQVDSLLPMLRSFRGKAEFHIAAETYLTAAYQLKPSTLRGAASITGKDLILLDGEQFTEISKILMFNKKTENLIDSINAEMTLFRNEVDIYPLQITMDKYKAIVAGHHNLDMSFDYHISLVHPLRIGVNVGGKLGKIKVVPCAAQYTDQYQPTSRHVVENQQLALRQMIREAIRKEL